MTVIVQTLMARITLDRQVLKINTLRPIGYTEALMD
jgi:hypothetical protein